MNLRQLEVFRAVMLAGSVRGAAAVLHVSPPAVSKQLATIERRTGLVLFERIKGRLVPTPEARQFYAEVEPLWEDVIRLPSVARQILRAGGGELRLGVSPSLGPFVPVVLQRVYADYPHLKVHVDLLVPPLLREALLNGDVDIAVALCPLSHPNLICLDCYECRLVCLIPEGHPLEQHQVVTPADLAGHRVISFSQSAAPNPAVARVLATLDVSVELRSGPNACWFAQAGSGIAIVDEAVVAGNALVGVAIRPFVESPLLEVCVQCNHYRPLSQAGRKFRHAFEQEWLAAGKHTRHR